jgi:L-threonylcarbamoyladenylate synthase
VSVGFRKAGGEAHDAVLEPCPFGVAYTIERCEFPGSKFSNPFDDRFDQVELGRGEVLGSGEFVDAGVNADGEKLIGGGRGEGGHGRGFQWLYRGSRIYRPAMTRKYATERLSADAHGIARASELLRAGGLVAVPTETVYGLAARADSEAAVAKIYDAKGRPSFNPLIVHVASLEQAERLAELPQAARELAVQHWPGPLTLVLPRRRDAALAAAVSAGLPTVALRCPAHSVMRAVIDGVGGPLAAPSANRSGFVSPTSAEHVLATLDGRIDAVLDAGRCSAGLESTIAAVRADGRIDILRPGPLDLGAAQASGDVEAPGQLASHYAPGKPLRLNAVKAESREFLLGFGAVRGDASLSENGDLSEAAARLYACLHLAAAASQPRIAVAPIPEEGLGIAINDRLRRAAAP